VPDDVEGAALPLRVEAALGLLEEDVPGGVQARDRPPEEEPGQPVPGQHVEAVVHDQCGRVNDQVEDAQQLRPHPCAWGLRAAATLPREPVEVSALGLIEAEDAGERVEHLLGRLGRAALLEAHVVVDADPGQVRDLLPTQPLDPPVPVGGDADGRRVDPRTPGAQEAREIVHALSVASVVPVRVVLLLPGSPVRWKQRP
jgi:hypothetical protein